jgi:peroxiredoxin
MGTNRSQVVKRSRRHSRTVLVMAAAVAGITAAVILGWYRPAPQGATAANLAAAGPEVGRSAPALSVPALAGGQLTLARYAGHPRVIGFFAASCIDCRPDLAALEQAYRRYQRQGLVVLGIGVQTTADDARWFAKQVGATFPIGYDEIGDLAVRTYRLYGVPTTVFISADGVVRGVLQGRVTGGALNQYLALILPRGIAPQ